MKKRTRRQTLTAKDFEKLLDRVRERIVSVREERGFSQQEIAEASGLSTGMVGMLESGQRHPSLETLARLSVALDADMFPHYDW